MSSPRLRPRGSSLIEAMAALVVFSVGILGVMQMNVLASRQNNLARSRTVASKIGRDLADAFERLPFNHPLFAPSGMLITDPTFDELSQPTGLMPLQSAAGLPGVRPLLGAADSIFASDGNSDFYQVAWRTAELTETGSDGLPVVSRRIVIMVGFGTPGGGVVQVNTWAIKYDPSMITGDPQNAPEL